MTDIHSCSYYCDRPKCIKAQRDELRDKAAQPEQEDGCPVCGSDVHDRDALDKAEREIERLTALLAQRTWIGLTHAERNKLWRDVVKWGDPSHDDVDLMKAIEAKLKEKNT
jgi:hypothetical protein